MEDGVKSIIVRGKRSGKNYQFNLPSHRKLDMKAVASLVGERCEFEDEGVIRERYGLLPGAVPPFGDVLGIWSYVDEAVLARTVSAFNCGLRTESVVMERQALLSVIEVKIARFAVETGGNPPTTDTGC
jgi:nondiscriminating aspartyl-tRNA synthetase